ncbi:MAG: subclass B1 metallo-beta-lactamase [Spirochaetales bacterium]|nr:subclass B1 metallo-beta-lactamase [Spirochaetales bacterium]
MKLLRAHTKRVVVVLTGFILCALPLSARPGVRTTVTPDLYLEQIADSVWIHESFTSMKPWGRIGANGLALVSGNRLILIDTPWTDELTGDLVNWFFSNRGCTDVSAIVCHYHQDNLGGLGWVHEQGYESYSLKATIDLCRQKGLPVPRNPVTSPHTFRFGDTPVTLYFPGEGHTVDSVCVYLSTERILFGGCSVKSLESRTLGNTAEANLGAWPGSLRAMKRMFGEARIVVPGHGKAGDLSLIDHTLVLLDTHRSSHD